MNRFYRIPAGAGIEPAVNANDVYLKHESVDSWYRETREINGETVPVVVLNGADYSLVRDGSWSAQLDSCVGGCDGGIVPSPGGKVRVAYGGVYQANPSGFDLVELPNTGDWKVLTSDVVPLNGYEGVSTSQMAYDLTENSITLNWDSPVPAGANLAQFTVVWGVAAVGNDQVYEFGLLVNGNSISPPGGNAVMSYERAGDVETLVQQGQTVFNDGDKIQLMVRNTNGTNPLRLYQVNFRLTVLAQEPVLLGQ